MTSQQLRVLIANEREDRIALVTTLVGALGHIVIAGSTNVADVGALTAQRASGRRARRARHQLGACARADRAHRARGRLPRDRRARGPRPRHSSTRPRSAACSRTSSTARAEELQSALDITLRRFAEYHNLQGAFGRRAQTERAKGILMERNQIDERQAFEMLRDHARHSGQKLVHVAQAVLDGHLLLASAARRRTADRADRAEGQS